MAAVLALTGWATGCVPADQAPAPVLTGPLGAPGTISYDGVETVLLEDDLVSITARLRGATGPEAAETYARCAAARYTLIRGFGFARHVRTQVEQSDDQWVADAVYTVSAALPPGVARIDAEVLVADCVERGIPTI